MRFEFLKKFYDIWTVSINACEIIEYISAIPQNIKNFDNNSKRFSMTFNIDNKSNPRSLILVLLMISISFPPI